MPHRELLQSIAHPDAMRALDTAHAPKSMTTEEHHAEIDRQFKEYEDAGINVSAFRGAKAWHEKLPNVKPSDVLEAVYGKGADLRGVTMRLSEASLRVYSSTGTVHGAKHLGVDRRFQLDEGWVSHEYLKLDENSKGGGAIKKMFAASVPVYQKMGLKQIHVHANLDGGGYAWGRYGFHANDPAQYHNEMRGQLLGTAESIARNLKHKGIKASTEAQAELSAIGKVLQEHKNNKELPRILSAMKTPHLTEELNKLDPERRKETSFVNEAMRHTDWYGHLDLTNKAQLEHLSAYVGKPLTNS